MNQRIAYETTSAGVLQAMYGLERHVRSSAIERSLLDLVRLRVSFINGCAYCVDMHTKEARLAGESEQRLYAVPVWRETSFFSNRERLAFEWAEAVTRISPECVDDALFDRVRGEFGEADLVDLTLGVVAINGWNRLAIAFRTEPGTYEPAGTGRAEAGRRTGAQPGAG